MEGGDAAGENAAHASLVPAPGTLIYDEDMEAGRLCSACLMPGTSEIRGLALLPRFLLDGETPLRVGGENGPLLELCPNEG